jgi:deoxyribodipyrimidine photo-lyase
MISVPTQSMYNASKAAVRAFSDALREEIRDSRVHVLCVHPGGIKTRIARQSRLGDYSALAATPDIGGTPAPLKQRAAMTMLADGLDRAAARLGIAAERVDATFGVDAMRDWAARHRLTQIITADAPVGPVKDRLDMLAPALAADGVRLVRLRRAWDDAAWPHARKGFFPFKSAVPKLLALPPGALA